MSLARGHPRGCPLLFVSVYPSRFVAAAPVFERSQPDRTFESAVEVRPEREPRELAHALGAEVGARQELFGPLHAQPFHVLLEGHSLSSLEELAEVGRRKPR